MLGDRFHQGLRAGFVAAAATLGVLIGFGRAHGATFWPLNTVAHMLFGTRASFMESFDPIVTLVALTLHIITLIVIAIVFVTFAGRLRGSKLLVAALLYAGVVFVINHSMVPARLTPGFEAVLSRVELGAVYVVLALALALGVRSAAPA